MQVSVQAQKHVMFGDIDGREKYFVKCSIFDDEQKGEAARSGMMMCRDPRGDGD